MQNHRHADPVIKRVNARVFAAACPRCYAFAAAEQRTVTCTRFASLQHWAYSLSHPLQSRRRAPSVPAATQPLHPDRQGRSRCPITDRDLLQLLPMSIDVLRSPIRAVRRALRASFRSCATRRWICSAQTAESSPRNIALFFSQSSTQYKSSRARFPPRASTVDSSDLAGINLIS
jgi:hypothetical protein